MTKEAYLRGIQTILGESNVDYDVEDSEPGDDPASDAAASDGSAGGGESLFETEEEEFIQPYNDSYWQEDYMDAAIDWQKAEPEEDYVAMPPSGVMDQLPTISQPNAPIAMDPGVATPPMFPTPTPSSTPPPTTTPTTESPAAIPAQKPAVEVFVEKPSIFSTIADTIKRAILPETKPTQEVKPVEAPVEVKPVALKFAVSSPRTPKDAAELALKVASTPKINIPSSAQTAEIAPKKIDVPARDVERKVAPVKLNVMVKKAEVAPKKIDIPARDVERKAALAKLNVLSKTVVPPPAKKEITTPTQAAQLAETIVSPKPSVSFLEVAPAPKVNFVSVPEMKAEITTPAQAAQLAETIVSPKPLALKPFFSKVTSKPGVKFSGAGFTRKKSTTMKGEEEEYEERRILPSPISGVSNEAWTDFAIAMRTAQMGSVSASNALGGFEMKPRRLADLGLFKNIRCARSNVNGKDRMVWIGDPVPPLTLEVFLSDPKLQYAAFSKSMERYVKGLRDGSISKPEGGALTGTTLSGILAVLHRAGPNGLKRWNDEDDRFDETKDLFSKTNGIF